jgi:hypothetical protein
MNGDDQEFQQRLICALQRSAPATLRAATLNEVQRELGAARFDRRLGRLAAAVLFVGIGLNAALVLRGDARSSDAAEATMARGSQTALAQTAVVVADATDAETARRFVRQMAALGRWELADE